MFCLIANNLNFHWMWRQWDWIQDIFLNLFYFGSNNEEKEMTDRYKKVMTSGWCQKKCRRVLWMAPKRPNFSSLQQKKELCTLHHRVCNPSFFLAEETKWMPCVVISFVLNWQYFETWPIMISIIILCMYVSQTQVFRFGIYF